MTAAEPLVTQLGDTRGDVDSTRQDLLDRLAAVRAFRSGSGVELQLPVDSADNRERARKELDSLNLEAERGELDEEGKEEARKIREYLGIPHPASRIPHPAQPSADEAEAAS